ncbi:MAG TPA: hypothetical protein VFM18_14600, partial [Methanosarcina sp.]|nr:hypothetical protein [Methanosarcina sp.]
NGTTITGWSVATSPEYDATGGAFDPVNGTFTVPAAPSAGLAKKYLVSGNITFAQSSNANSENHYIEVFVGATSVAKYAQPPIPNSTNGLMSVAFSVNITTADADVITIKAHSAVTGTSLTIQPTAQTWWGMVLLSNS